MAIITWSEYKTYAGITSTADDTRGAVLVANIEGELARYTGRHFSWGAETNPTELRDGKDADTIQLTYFPFATAAQITSVQWVNPDLTVLRTWASDSYYYEEATGILGLKRCGDGPHALMGRGSPMLTDHGLHNRFPDGFRNILVTYTPGEAVAWVAPAELKQLMYDLVDWRRARWGSDPTLVSETLGKASYTRAQGENATSFRAFMAEIAADWRIGGGL